MILKLHINRIKALFFKKYMYGYMANIIIKQKVILLGSIIFRVDYKSQNKLSSSDNGNEMMWDEALIRKQTCLNTYSEPRSH